MKKKHKPKKFRVYYYVGDYFSSKGEERRSKVIYADSEKEKTYDLHYLNDFIIILIWTYVLCLGFKKAYRYSTKGS